MNVIWRNSVSCLRIGKMPHRYQSGYHPVAPLGSRILTDPAKVFEHNMWDHMQWSKEAAAAARKKVEENSAVRVLPEEQVKYETEASRYWDTFYKIHKNKFFKDRNWLLREFPEILPVDQKTEDKAGEVSWDHVKTNAANCVSRMHCPTMPEEKNLNNKNYGLSQQQGKAGSDFTNLDYEEHRKGPLKTELFPGSMATFRILEVGCGAGNSVFPILNILQNAPESFLYCCDFASLAVELVKSHASYRAAQCSAFVHDVCDDDLPYPFPDGILDVILLVFVLSSIHPDRMQGAINRLSKLLKPGGILLFRDYGRYDMTQLRFKKGHCLSENFYVRGDGTRAYFFTKGTVSPDVKKLMTCHNQRRAFDFMSPIGNYLSLISSSFLKSFLTLPKGSCIQGLYPNLREVQNMFYKAGLDEKQNLVDRRLQVNREKQVKMHRVWVQGKFQKPLHLT